jgi:hypothetical protein
MTRITTTWFVYRLHNSRRDGAACCLDCHGVFRTTKLRGITLTTASSVSPPWKPRIMHQESLWVGNSAVDISPWSRISTLKMEAARPPKRWFPTTKLHGVGAGIAQWYRAGLRAGWSGFESWQGVGIFHFTTVSRPALGPTQPPIRWVPGALFLGVKWPKHEAHRSLPYSAEVNNAWSYTSTPPIRLHCVVISLKKSTGTTLPFNYTV